MKLRVVGVLAALCIAAVSMGADAQNKGKAPPAKAKEAKPAELTGPAKMKGRLALTPKGLAWGISLEAVAKIYDKVIDDEALPLYKKMQPGPAMEALDAKVADDKQVIRRNKVVFGDLPTGVDQSALNGEYSYGNKESMTKLRVRTGVVRNFFFFDDKLWKVYDEHKLKKGGRYGENWEEALQILTKAYGAVEPYKVEADFAKGRNFPEAQWQDGTTVIRAINREPTLGLVYQDSSIYFNLPKYRPNKPKDPHAIDKDVKSATDKPPPEPPKEKDKGKQKQQKPKGKK